MKSEILYLYDFTNKFLVNSLIALPDDSAIILAQSEKTEEYHLLFLKEGKYFSINISQRLTALSNYKLSIKNMQTRMIICKFGNGFALIVREYVYIWDNFFQDCKEYKIVNDFKIDKANRYMNPVRAVGIDNNSIIYSFTDYSYNNVARYYCILDINDHIAEWRHLSDNIMYKDLPYDQYPSIKLPLHNWLVIQDLTIKDNNIYFFTIGEEKNYYKYGMDYCVLSKNDLNGNVISLIETEKGLGFFASSKNYLIVHSLRRKTKVYFYKLEDHTEQILNLSKKNLGHLEKEFLQFDLIHNKLWMYNADGISCCKLDL